MSGNYRHKYLHVNEIEGNMSYCVWLHLLTQICNLDSWKFSVAFSFCSVDICWWKGFLSDVLRFLQIRTKRTQSFRLGQRKKRFSAKLSHTEGWLQQKEIEKIEENQEGLSMACLQCYEATRTLKVPKIFDIHATISKGSERHYVLKFVILNCFFCQHQQYRYWNFPRKCLSHQE